MIEEHIVKNADPSIRSDLLRFINGDIDVNDNPRVYEYLYEYFMEEMPYGVMKARDGDPDQWITDRIETMFPLGVENVNA